MKFLIIAILLAQPAVQESYKVPDPYFPSGLGPYMRNIYNSDVNKWSLVKAVPIAYLNSNERMRLSVKGFADDGTERTVGEFHFRVHPETAGAIEVENGQYFYRPTITYDGMGMVDAWSLNSRNDVIIGQMHFIVKRIR